MNKETIEDARFKAYTDFFESNQDVEMYSFVGGFNKGSKWQQENSNVDVLEFEIATLKSLITDMDTTIKSKYSEEEVKSFALQAVCFIGGNWDSSNLMKKFNEWFEQFKKK
jgi:hypothetical protein